MIEEYTDKLWKTSSGERLNVLFEICAKIRSENGNPETAAELIDTFWPICDGFCHDHTRVEELLVHYSEDWKAYNRKNAPDLWKPLDGKDSITIFRGCDISKSLGCSWTLDREVAKEFAEGHRGKRHPNPVLIQAQVPPQSIVALLNEREEEEVVVNLYSADLGLKFDSLGFGLL